MLCPARVRFSFVVASLAVVCAGPIVTRAADLTVPVGWTLFQGEGSGFTAVVDSAVRHGGIASGRLQSLPGVEEGFASLQQAIRGEAYRNKRVRLVGYVRTEDMPDTNQAAMWLRIDGEGRTLALDNMSDRAPAGPHGWLKHEIVLDVPLDAVGLVCGLILSGAGKAWVDDVSIAVVGPDVAVTAAAMPGERNAQVLQTQVAYFGKRPRQLVNARFEGGWR
jgi:hypothetical protein